MPGKYLNRFIDEKVDGMAYYYEGEEGSEMRKVITNFIVGNSHMCSRLSMCVKWISKPVLHADNGQSGYRRQLCRIPPC